MSAGSNRKELLATEASGKQQLQWPQLSPLQSQCTAGVYAELIKLQRLCKMKMENSEKSLIPQRKHIESNKRNAVYLRA